MKLNVLIALALSLGVTANAGASTPNADRLIQCEGVRSKHDGSVPMGGETFAVVESGITQLPVALIAKMPHIIDDRGTEIALTGIESANSITKQAFGAKYFGDELVVIKFSKGYILQLGDEFLTLCR